MTYHVYSPRRSVGSLATTTATAAKASEKKWIAQLQTSSLLFQHLICQLLAIFFRSRIHKDCILKSLCCVNVLREIRKFHVVVLQWRQRNVHNSLMHVQSCCFAVLARWRRCCCLIGLTKITHALPVPVHRKTIFIRKRVIVLCLNTWYVELNSPSSRATTVNSPNDSFLCSIFCWYYVNGCRDTKGNRGRNESRPRIM